MSLLSKHIISLATENKKKIIAWGSRGSLVNSSWMMEWDFNKNQHVAVGIENGKNIKERKNPNPKLREDRKHFNQVMQW